MEEYYRAADPMKASKKRTQHLEEMVKVQMEKLIALGYQ
jgi:hypothetical protein